MTDQKMNLLKVAHVTFLLNFCFASLLLAFCLYCYLLEHALIRSFCAMAYGNWDRLWYCACDSQAWSTGLMNGLAGEKEGRMTQH